MRRRIGTLSFCLLLAVSLFSPISIASLEAQDKFPSKPIKFIIPYAPGSATDTVTRIMNEELRQILGQSCIVDNKPGAFGILAIEEMVRSQPDGYTLQVGNVSTNGIAPILYASKMKINYNRDVVPVAKLTDLPNLLVVTTKDFAPKTLGEFVAYAKKHPGQLKYATPANGSFPHYDTEIFARRAGITMKGIHIKAGPPGFIKDMAKGDIHIALMNIATATPQIKAGILRPLAVVWDKRVPAYPDVPTMAEAGFPGVGTMLWSALFAPAATPKDVLQTLNEAVKKAMTSQRVLDALEKANIRSCPSASLAEAKTWFEGEIDHWQKIIKEVPITVTN